MGKREWLVAIPVVGRMEVKVQADNETEAITQACRQAAISCHVEVVDQVGLDDSIDYFTLAPDMHTARVLLRVEVDNG